LKAKVKLGKPVTAHCGKTQTVNDNVLKLTCHIGWHGVASVCAVSSTV